MSLRRIQGLTPTGSPRSHAGVCDATFQVRKIAALNTKHRDPKQHPLDTLFNSSSFYSKKTRGVPFSIFIQKIRKFHHMCRNTDLHRVLNTGIVAIIRASSGDQLVNVARALYEGGIDIIEVTFTTPGVVEVISAVRKELGNKVLLGAGTVLDPETARIALLAGAEFIVSPCVNLDVIKLAHRYDKLVMPGAYTPTEIVTAWEAGADVVKLFPADIGGAAYLKALKGPLPQVRIMPTGGVNQQTLREFIKAGASSVGLGSQLVEKDAVERGDFARIRQLATEYVQLIQQSRK
jgi:2-dehydro-3-deoxyphosphogluconate aldolase/(4S)-4-hydroxy-2-oxoglutarate aldolase